MNETEKDQQILQQNAEAAARAPVTATATGGSQEETPDFLLGFREKQW